jgi:BirA family biotin operon repressor/biotin-[acetyl-CoA-carboxylase] ligase
MSALDLQRAKQERGRFALKWPNDLVADGSKLAGILLGTETLTFGRRAVVIGIGVNVTSAPDGLPYPATSLRTLGCDADSERVFAALADCWVALEKLWDLGVGSRLSANSGFRALPVSVRRWRCERMPA